MIGVLLTVLAIYAAYVLSGILTIVFFRRDDDITVEDFFTRMLPVCMIFGVVVPIACLLHFLDEAYNNFSFREFIKKFVDPDKVLFKKW